jgi:hypothetical protein
MAHIDHVRLYKIKEPRFRYKECIPRAYGAVVHTDASNYLVYGASNVDTGKLSKIVTSSCTPLFLGSKNLESEMTERTTKLFQPGELVDISAGFDVNDYRGNEVIDVKEMQSADYFDIVSKYQIEARNIEFHRNNSFNAVFNEYQGIGIRMSLPVRTLLQKAMRAAMDAERDLDKKVNMNIVTLDQRLFPA